MSPTASFWDCGEFIACANELEVPHPPGAPFFMLLGRIFAMFAFNDVESISWMLNLMSVLSSTFTVLFTFWITTHLALRLVVKGDEKPNHTRLFVIMAAGVVAGLANTYADSFWFNAVEAEVYAMSSFFTAVVVWLMFKWEERADQPDNLRWLILIAYLMGLSIGVHLLNLLTIPALAFIYYFRKYDFSWQGFFVTGAVAVAILGVVQTGIIISTFDIAWEIEKFFAGIEYANGTEKSGLGLPIGSGVIFFFIFLAAALSYLIYYSHKNHHVILNTAAISAMVIYIGFSSYLMIPIRSSANPPIDQNNPEDTQTFLSYMKREQYGNRPLLQGPLYNALPVGLEEVGKEYILEEGADRYKEIGTKRQYEYREQDKKFFPRMYEKSRYNSGPHAYVNYVKRTGSPNDPNDDRPTAAEDLRFFFGYQIIHMYWRYFMWNFTGKEGDVQDQGWESGFEFGKLSKMPDFMKENPAKNHYYFLPFLLGLLGLFWQAYRRGEDATVVGFLFFFTGLAIIIYLNQYPAQPRERDYSFAGSFQTYAIWIGLGVIGLYQLLERYLKGSAVYVAAAVGLLAPVLMGVQNWTDHSRAGRYVAPDSAYNLLNSCEKDAVLFTNGDNDTFPLWYLQEVEGVRTDVRVLCLSYVNTDWYIDQMYLQMNESPPLPLSLKPDDYTGQANQSRSMGSRERFQVSLPASEQALQQQGIISEEELPFVTSPMTWEATTRGSGNNRYLELKDIVILNLLENVAKGNWERPIYFANTVSPSSFLGLDDHLRLEGLAYRILPLKKPSGDDRYDPFQGSLDLERMYTHLTQEFRYRNLNQPGIYVDENIMRMLSNYHNTFYRLSNGYLRESESLNREAQALEGRLEANPTQADSLEQVMNVMRAEAQAAKDRALEVMLFTEEKFPYTVITPDPYLVVRAGLMFDRLGEKEKAEEYFAFGRERSLGTLKYYSKTGDEFSRIREYYYPLNILQQYYQQNNLQEELQSLNEEIQALDQRMLRN